MTQHRCPSPRTCQIPSCRRARFSQNFWGFMSLLAFGAALLLTKPAHAADLSLDGAVPTLNLDMKQEPVWRTGMTQTGDKPKPFTDPSLSWTQGYVWNHEILNYKYVWQDRQPGGNYPAFTSNGHADVSPNYDMVMKLGKSLGPISWSYGVLNLTAKPIPAYIQRMVGPEDQPKNIPPTHISGTITSFPYAQQYGVFSMVAKIPKGKGVWPAFWLLPADLSWPPELDIMEVLGSAPDTLVTTVHFKDAAGNNQQTAHATKTVDLSADYHEYTVDWGPVVIKWFLDGKLIFTTPTPPSLNKPCYVIANLAIGKATSWGGAPDAATVFPAQMKIHSIKVWQRQYVR